MTNTTDHFDNEKGMDLPLLPLKDIVIFPHMIVPVFINEDLCINAVEESLAANRKIFLSAFKVPGIEGEGLECSLKPPFDVYTAGTLCTIMRTRKLPDGRMKVLIQGIQKARIIELLNSEEYPNVRVELVKEPVFAALSPEDEAMIRAVRENLQKVVSLGKILSPDILMILEDVKDPGRLADLVAANLGLKVEEAQAILAVANPIKRLKKVHAFLSREIEVFQMQVKIQSQAKEEIGRLQREHYLREQIRALKQELGDGDNKDDIETLWAQFEKTKLSKEGHSEVKKQLGRLERMHADSSESTLTRNHIETILSLPWGKYKKEDLDLKKVNEVLDADHFGLEQVKDRIVEYLAVKKLNQNAKSPIICFLGPPGVGKTSLGRSIAKAMGRRFSRISLGGVRDEADIRGHRKTYVGAYPGRVIQSLKQAGSANPVIMLDEIDKLGADHRGDPAAALLEVLDPEQNNKFVDHYLGIAFDLSKVMFISNANSLESIPQALRDRLEIIDVSGYSELEKTEIAQKFLVPKTIMDSGLEGRGIAFSNAAVLEIIRGYTRESGLRNLEKQIASICRKIARSLAEEKPEFTKSDIKVSPALTNKLLGVRKYDDQFYHAEATKGVALGMAYTQVGGEILAIESNLISGKGRLVLTGHLGNVMKESCQTAYSYIRSNLKAFGISEKVLFEHELHIHVPSGGVPKDGPSAGIAIVSSIISALKKQPPSPMHCMTGEISLHGKVLPIGGLKEKILAAQREGMKKVILPEKNKLQFLGLSATIKAGLEFEFVANYSEVYQILFNKQANKREKKPHISAVQDLAS